jgi:DNA repair exonuclease SbcCD nuclease subunit
MIKRFLVVGDIHFGYYPPELLYKEFQIIMDTIVEYKNIDCVVIAGDYYDTKLSMASAHSVYSVKAFSELIKLCENYNIKVRHIKGTNSHDPENQLKNLAQIANSSKCDYKLFMTVDEEEIFPGMKVLYIPEEYMENSDEYYKEFFNKKYQLVFGHGMFEETNFSSKNKFKTMKKYPIFNSKQMEDICEGPIVFGHIHTAQRIRNRIQYTGSLVRSRYGEEEAKGFYVVDFDTETKESEFEFIENNMTMRYDTIEVNSDNPIFSGMVNEQIAYFKNLVETYKKDYLRVKINIPEDMINSSTFIDNMNVVFNDMKNVKLQIVENSKVKLDNELREKVNLLMDKYNFIFDKSVGYDEKIREYIKLKTGKEISLDRIRSMISGNSFK